MAPTRRSARVKASGDRAATPPATVSTTTPSKATRAKPVAKLATKPSSKKKTTRATRSRKTGSPEPEVVGEDEEERGPLDAVRAHVKKSTTPTDTIASLKQSPQSRSTRGRVMKRVVSKKAAALVGKNVSVVEDITPTTRKSTRGNVAESETATNPTHPAESESVSEAPVVKGRPKRTGKKVNPFEESEHQTESSASAVTPHWAKRIGRGANARNIKKAEVEVEMGARIDDVPIGEVVANTGVIEVVVKKPNVEVEAVNTEPVIEKTKGRKKKVAATKKDKKAAKLDLDQQSRAKAGEGTEMVGGEVGQNTEVGAEAEVRKIDTVILDAEPVEGINSKKAEMDVMNHEAAIEDQDEDVEIDKVEPVVEKSKKGRAKKARKGAVSRRGKAKKKVEVVEEDDEEATQPDVQAEDIQMGENYEVPAKIEPVTDSGIFVDSQTTEVAGNPGSSVEDNDVRMVNDSDVAEERKAKTVSKDLSEQVGAAESEPIVVKGKDRKNARKGVSKKGKKKAGVVEDESSNIHQNAGAQGESEGSVKESKIFNSEVNVGEGEVIEVVKKAGIVEPAVTIAEPETAIAKNVEVVNSSTTAVGPGITPTEVEAAIEEKVDTERPDITIGESKNDITPQRTETGNDEQEPLTHVVKPRKKAKKSAATQKKGRAAKAAAKKAKGGLGTSAVDAEEESNVEEEEDGHKSVASSSRTIDPAVILGSKKASGVKKTEKKRAAPVARLNPRRGRSAVNEPETIVEDNVNDEPTEGEATNVIDEQLKDIHKPGVTAQGSDIIEEISVVEGTVVVTSEIEINTNIIGDNGSKVVIELESKDAVLEEESLEKVVTETIGQEVEGNKVETHEEEDDVSLPMPMAPIILSPTRFSPDPDVDPIKSSAPSSPVTRSASHQHHNSSPLRKENSNPVLASPSQVTTPRASPIKKLSTPSARTPINNLSQTGTPHGRNLEDSRDIAILPNSTPTRQLDVNIASSPVMLPPTPDVYRNHPRSPVKQTPTKESGSVKGEVTLGDFGLKMGGSSEHGLLDKSIENIMSSPTKNSSPAQAESLTQPSPAGRLSFGPTGIPQSSPIVRRLDNEQIPVLSSPIAASSVNASPTKSSPLKKSNLDFLRQPLTPPAVRNAWPTQSESIGSPVGDDTFADRSSYRRVEDELVGGYSEEDDDEEELRPYAPHTHEAQEEVEEQKASYTNMLPEEGEEGEEEEHSEANDSRASVVDESQLFKLADKARSMGNTSAIEEEVEVAEENGEQHRILTSRVSDLDFSVLEQVHPELAQPEDQIVNPQAAVGGVEEEGEGGVDIAECDLTFTAGDDDALECPSSPISPIGDILSPIKFDYAPTSEIFPPRAEDVLSGAEAEAFSPIMPYDHTFDTSAVLWGGNGDDEEEEDDGEEQVGSFSTCDRLRAVRASSPPNIWDELDSRTSPASPDSPYDHGLAQGGGEEQEQDDDADLPGDDTEFERSFARGLAAEKQQEQAYESINMLPDVGDETDFEMSFARGIAEEMEEMKREKEEQEQKEKEERVERGKKRFADGDGGNLKKRVKGGGDRRHTFNPGEEEKEAKRVGLESRRRSHPGVLDVTDRQFYLRASNPEKIAEDWAEHARRVTSERAAVAVIQRTWKRYKAVKAAAPPIHRPAAVTSSSALQQAPVRPSRIPGVRRLRSVSNTAASSSSSSTPLSTPSNEKGKRKADEPLDSGTGKSNIPISARNFIGRGGVEKALVKRNTEHNALYSVSVRYQPIRKNQRRPSSLDVETAAKMAAAVAREMRERAEEEGKVLHPGEQEEYVALVEKKGKKGIKWDDKLVYCEEDLSRVSHSHSQTPGRSILTSKPLLTAMGNWVPTPGASAFVVPSEVVVVKKVVYSDDKKGKGKK